MGRWNLMRQSLHSSSGLDGGNALLIYGDRYLRTLCDQNFWRFIYPSLYLRRETQHASWLKRKANCSY